MKIVRHIPNLLTLSRIGVAILLGGIMIYSLETTGKQCAITLFLLLTVFIYLSDFVDGRLARYLHAVSPIGGKADIMADLFYMLSQMGILVCYGYMNGILICVVLLEFIVFIITSLDHSKSTHTKEIWFDKIGRMTAVYYYMMPLIYVIIPEYFQGQVQNAILVLANVLCCFLTLAAVVGRVGTVYWGMGRSLCREK